MQPPIHIEDATELLTVELVYPSDYDFVVWKESRELYVYVVTLGFTLFQPPPPAPEFPPFPIKACILGKSFSGKTTVAQRLASGKCV